MFRIHNISRMFMCRCCNWAFSDKTSLHIHMQSMLRNGTPGEVAILARSSTEDGPTSTMDESPRGSPSYSTETLLTHHFMNHSVASGTGTASSNINNNNNAKTTNNNTSIKSIFPMIMRKENLLTHMKKGNLLSPLDLSPLSSNRWFSTWLANNPFTPNMEEPQQPNGGSNEEETTAVENGHHEDADYDALEITMDESDFHDDETAEGGTSVIVNPCCLSSRSADEVRGSHKRKATRPQQVTDALSADSSEKLEPTCKQPYCSNGDDQSSLTISDAHSSGTSVQRTDTPGKCFDCQIVKDKLNASQSKMLEYERKINYLEAKIVELQRSVHERSQGSDTSRADASSEQNQLAAPEAPGVALYPHFSPPLLFMHNPAVKIFLHNLMQSQLSRPSC